MKTPLPKLPRTSSERSSATITRWRTRQGGAGGVSRRTWRRNEAPRASDGIAGGPTVRRSLVHVLRTEPRASKGLERSHFLGCKATSCSMKDLGASRSVEAPSDQLCDPGALSWLSLDDPLGSVGCLGCLMPLFKGLI